MAKHPGHQESGYTCVQDAAFAGENVSVVSAFLSHEECFTVFADTLAVMCEGRFVVEKHVKSKFFIAEAIRNDRGLGKEQGLEGFWRWPNPSPFTHRTAESSIRFYMV